MIQLGLLTLKKKAQFNMKNPQEHWIGELCMTSAKHRNLSSRSESGNLLISFLAISKDSPCVDSILCRIIIIKI
jgi:hypothetical protein